MTLTAVDRLGPTVSIMTSRHIALLKLAPLNVLDVEEIRRWRNLDISPLRTSFPLTDQMQQEFYRNTVCNRQATSRHWRLENDEGALVGMGGFNPIQWENGLGEITLIMHPDKRGFGYGSTAVALLLEEAFDRMRLAVVCGEAYWNNPLTVEFWAGITKAYGGVTVRLPSRKFWNGQHWDAMYFSVGAEQYRKTTYVEAKTS